MNNKKILSRKKDFFIMLTKTLNRYNKTLCQLICVSNNGTNKPNVHLLKYIQKRIVQSIYITKIQTLPAGKFELKHKLCPKIISYVFIEGISCRYGLRCRKEF